jgi:hypothetical protein
VLLHLHPFQGGMIFGCRLFDQAVFDPADRPVDFAKKFTIALKGF